MLQSTGGVIIIPSEVDPEKIEPKYLHAMLDVAKAHVLEVGCGDGRLTWRYIASTGPVIGIDSDIKCLATALHDRPTTLRASLAVTQAQAEALPFPQETFDLAILAWSL